MKQNYSSLYLRIIGILIVLAIFVVPNVIITVKAQPTYSSPSYAVDEVFFGSGGVNDANSANYNARASLGDLGVGNTASSNYQAYGGFTTTNDPFIEVYVPATNIDLGYLSTNNATTTSATFRVRTWLANSYNVYTASDAPTNSGDGAHIIDNMPIQSSSSPGTEQFGINLVANTSPANFGANPAQLPDGTFSYGQANANYATPNQFRYNKGDSIAFSNQSSSVTEYTISYLYNISESTPAGEYVLIHDIVVTSVF